MNPCTFMPAAPSTAPTVTAPVAGPCQVVVDQQPASLSPTSSDDSVPSSFPMPIASFTSPPNVGSMVAVAAHTQLHTTQTTYHGPPSLTSASASSSSSYSTTSTTSNSTVVVEDMKMNVVARTPFTSDMQGAALQTPSPMTCLNLGALLPKKTKHGRIGGSLYRALKDAGIDVGAMNIPRGRPPRRKVGQKRPKRPTLLDMIKSGIELPRIPGAPDIPIIYPCPSTLESKPTPGTASSSSSSSSSSSTTPLQNVDARDVKQFLSQSYGLTDSSLRDVTNQQQVGRDGRNHNSSSRDFIIKAEGGGAAGNGMRKAVATPTPAISYQDPSMEACDDEESLVLSVLTGFRAPRV